MALDTIVLHSLQSKAIYGISIASEHCSQALLRPIGETFGEWNRSPNVSP